MPPSDATPNPTAHDGLHVSAEARKALDALVAGLRSALADKLVGVLAHGSAVRGGWTEGRSDVDILVILRDGGLATLEAIANPLRIARNSARIECMLLTEAEIPRAADAFPVFYDDVKRHRAIVHGSDPFAKLEIHDEHMRLRVEQELREVQIRLRRAVTDAVGGPDRALAGAIARKVRQVRGPLFALLGLLGKRKEGEARSDGLDDVLRASGEAFDVQVAVLSDPWKKPAEAHKALAELLSRAIDAVDRLEVRATTAGTK